MPSIRLFLSLLVILALASCAGTQSTTATIANAPPPVPCQQTIATTVPVFFDKEGTPIVIAAIGSIPAAMVVDTGAEGTIISRQLAVQLGMTGFFKEINYRFVRIGGIGGSTAAFVEPAPPITLGNAQAKNMKIYVLTKDTGQVALGTKSAVDGIMGNDIWFWNNLYLDFPDGKLILVDRQSCLRPAPNWPGKIIQVPFSAEILGYIVLPVAVDGHAIMAILDTGAAVSTLPGSLLSAAGLKPENAIPLRVIRLVGAGGVISADLDRFKIITIGDQSFPNPVFAVPQIGVPDYQGLGVANPYGDMIIGEDFIRRHRIFISYATHTLYIQE